MPSAGRWPERAVWWGPALVAAAGAYAWVVAYFAAYTYWLPAGAIALSLGLLCTFTRLTGPYALLLLTLPLAVELPLGSTDHRLLLPSEGLMVVLGLAVGGRLLLRRPPGRYLLGHPLTRLLLLYFAAMAATTLTSARPVVSLKFLVVNAANVAVFYFIAADFLRRPSRVVAFFFLYGASMVVVIGYALYHHSTVNFYHDAAGIVVRPFFADHTQYSACLAMLLPGFVAFAARGAAFGLSRAVRRSAGAVAVLLTVAIFLSFSRATWVGVGVALLYYGALRARLRPVYLAGTLLIGLGGAVGFQEELIDRLKLNRHSSSDLRTDLADQTLSVTNISGDVSNAERLNRWSCAWRMFRDRPLTGFGPGTYQFEYLPYQRAEEMTRISVSTAYNHPFGRGGTAHSEYLLALAESGVVGFGLFTALVVGIVFTCLRAYRRAPDELTRLLVAVAGTGLVSFCTHALFNNFLNSNKVAGLFWGLLALLVWLDRRSRPTNADASEQ